MSAELSVLAKKNLSSDDQKLLADLTKPDVQINVLVPTEIDPKEWKATVSVVCRALARVEIQKRKLMPVLGRLLVIARDNQEIWKAYEKFEEFMESEIYSKFSLSRSSCYEAMEGAVRFGHLEIAECEVIPRRNFRIVMRAVAKGEEKKGYAKALLAKAAELPESELKAYCQKQGYLEVGEIEGEFIKFGTNKARGKKIRAWLDNPHVQAKAGSDREDIIIEHMIAECAADWLGTPLIEQDAASNAA